MERRGKTLDTLKYLVERYSLDISDNVRRPIEIPNVGRNILGEWFKDLGYRVGLELGVERGIFSKILLDANPNLELFCVDPWQQYDGYTARLNNESLPNKYYEAQEKLKGFNVHFYKQFSHDAVKRFKDNSLDFVYIDANHDLPWCMDDIIWWEKKVRPGGILCGHDYIKMNQRKPSKVRVVEALRWYTELKPIKTWFIIGARAKVPGIIRDSDRSWMWVKE